MPHERDYNLFYVEPPEQGDSATRRTTKRPERRLQQRLKHLQYWTSCSRVVYCTSCARVCVLYIVCMRLCTVLYIVCTCLSTVHHVHVSVYCTSCARACVLYIVRTCPVLCTVYRAHVSCTVYYISCA